MKTSNRVLDRVLADLGVPHIEERLPRDFFYRLGLKFPQQYGIACRDVGDCIRRAEALGAGPFLHTHVRAPNWIERGQRRRGCRLEVALGYAGDVQIELLGPGQGTEHYSRALEHTDIAFHHVGIYQRGMTELASAMERAGYPEAVRGGVSLGNALRIDFRYFDARQDHGLYLEVLDFSVLGRELRVEPFIRGYARWMAGGGGRRASGR
ncbi:MAG TPA: VOC family protein [Polyangiales bacterium]|nr:VOC family protein [Polyangiales bacterium]